jgi:hypothetical protein
MPHSNRRFHRIMTRWCWLLLSLLASVASASDWSTSAGDIFAEPARWDAPGDSLHPQCCHRLFAPSMIGDSLGVPIALGSINRQVLHTQHFSKVADHNSPVPRTRVFSSYQRFESYSVVETQNNVADIQRDLHVFKLGFEKTLFDGNASIDVILPLHRTVSSESSNTSAPMAGELGNIAFGYKHVLYESHDLLISGGLRAEAPTEDDLTFGGGSQVILDEWYLQPWIGLIAEGPDDTFLHCFFAGRYTGGDVENLVVDFPPSSTSGQDLFMFDIGVGKWCHLNGELLRAVVPTLEFHYMNATGADSPFGLSNAIFGRNVDVANLTIGATGYVGDRSTVQVGFGIPLHTNTTVNPAGANGTFSTDRFYDWELLINWTLFSR